MTDGSHLLLQLLVILVAARVCGALARRIGQPSVVGEMVAGLALGPSLLGLLAPDVFGAIFPGRADGALSHLSLIGLVLFMLAVGAQFDPGHVSGKARAAVGITIASMGLPMIGGVLLAVPLHESLAPPGAAMLPFALFLGASMAVTAFPVLARILTERGLLHTRVGTMAIASAAVDDVAAWCLLALVAAIARGEGWGPAAIAAAQTIAFAAVMLTAGRRLLAIALARARERGTIATPELGLIAIVAVASAWLTEQIGVHALFGAFIAGAALPRDEAFRDALSASLSGLTAVLLPVYFAYTGLRAEVSLLSGGAMWMTMGLVLLVAVLGKFAGSALAARAGGLGWREALSIGALLNTRGLMELVIANVGLDLGIISPALFTMLVFMALLTTVAATPALALIARAGRPRAARPAGELVR